jgi:hypothetical protein
MKQIFEILQEERDRILSIHESATKNHYLGEQTLGPFNTANPQLDDAVKNLNNQSKPKGKDYWNLIQAAGQGNIKEKGSFTSVKVDKKVDDKVRGSFVDSSNYKSAFIAACTKPSVITLQGSSLQGTTLQVGTNLKDKISKMCGNNPTPEVKAGNETSTPDKLQHKLGSVRYLYNTDNKINYVLPKDKTIFKFNPDKNGATFRGYDYDPTTKKAGNVVYNGWFNCSSGKFQVKSNSGTFKYYSDKAFVDFLKAKCEKAKTEKGSLKKDNLGQSGTGSQSTSTSVVKPTEAALDLIIQKIPAGAQQPAATQQPPAGTQPPATNDLIA